VAEYPYPPAFASVVSAAQFRSLCGERCEQFLETLLEAGHALALELLGLTSTVQSVADSLQPHRLCTYLFAVASRFNSFYDQCPVLKADDEKTRQSRLALSAVTARVLAKGLDLLGIEAPEQM